MSSVKLFASVPNRISVDFGRITGEIDGSIAVLIEVIAIKEEACEKGTLSVEEMDAEKPLITQMMSALLASKYLDHNSSELFKKIIDKIHEVCPKNHLFLEKIIALMKVKYLEISNPQSKFFHNSGSSLNQGVKISEEKVHLEIKNVRELHSRIKGLENKICELDTKKNELKKELEKGIVQLNEEINACNQEKGVLETSLECCITLVMPTKENAILLVQKIEGKEHFFFFDKTSLKDLADKNINPCNRERFSEKDIHSLFEDDKLPENEKSPLSKEYKETALKYKDKYFKLEEIEKKLESLETKLSESEKKLKNEDVNKNSSAEYKKLLTTESRAYEEMQESANRENPEILIAFYLYFLNESNKYEKNTPNQKKYKKTAAKWLTKIDKLPQKKEALTLIDFIKRPTSSPSSEQAPSPLPVQKQEQATQPIEEDIFLSLDERLVDLAKYKDKPQLK